MSHESSLIPASPVNSRGNSESRRRRVAFVVQRCGREVNGGAELHCRLIAEHMIRHWDIEILTTCALDYMTWANHYPEGVEEYSGLRIRRFRVDQPRDVPAFNALSAELHLAQGNATLEQQEEWMRAQGPVSTGLLDHIRTHVGDYDLVVFFGYLYAQTYFGLPLAAGKAVLLPLAHDEWTIHLPMWNEFFRLPAAFIFNSEEELAFLRGRFPNSRLEGEIVGIGVTVPVGMDPWRFRVDAGLHAPYLLYVGRIDPSKGCATMFDWFLRAKRTRAIPHKLVLVGRPVMPVPEHPDIVSLGFVEDQAKYDAIAGCDWLLMPSEFESLSFAVLEAWAAGRPVMVNAGCDVLVGHCRRSHGGVWVADYDEWLAAIRNTREAEKKQLGLQGKAYAQRRYTWDRVEREYINVLKAVEEPGATAAARPPEAPDRSLSPASNADPVRRES